MAIESSLRFGYPNRNGGSLQFRLKRYNLNNDLHIDLVLCRDFNGPSMAYLGDGTGSFPTGTSIGAGFLMSRGGTIGDINNDGFADIIFANSQHGFETWSGNGSGTSFTLNQTVTVRPAPRLSRATDVTLFGTGARPSLIVTHTDPTNPHHMYNEIYGNRPWGAFVPAHRYTYDAVLGSSMSMRVLQHDFTGDGINEIIVVNTKSIVIWTTDYSACYQ